MSVADITPQLEFNDDTASLAGVVRTLIEVVARHRDQMAVPVHHAAQLASWQVVNDAARDLAHMLLLCADEDPIERDVADLARYTLGSIDAPWEA